MIQETTCSLFSESGLKVGDIDLRVTYIVTSKGTPQQHDDPGSSAEIDVPGVEMLNAPKAGRPAQWVDAWDWLYEWAGEWADRHADLLAAAARLEGGGGV
jgi:hypothetical protein